MSVNAFRRNGLMNLSLLRPTCRSRTHRLIPSRHRAALALLWVAAVLLSAGCQQGGSSSDSPQAPAHGRTFGSPQEAVQALTTAARAGDTAQLLDIMGP